MSFQVPFFSDEEENSNTPKADALFIPRENPRALFIRPIEKEKSAPPMDGPTPLQENGKIAYLHSFAYSRLLFNVKLRLSIVPIAFFLDKK